MGKPALIRLLPEFPRTLHLPHKPNAQHNDLVATEAKIIFEDRLIYVEEKVDGSSAGIALIDGHPVVRNRSHILKKGFLKDTPAKKQFTSIWGWFYENREKFERMQELLGGVTVYGEWMWAQHGLYYDRLPAWFIAYDVFVHSSQEFIDSTVARRSLQEAGFYVPPLLHFGKVESYEQLEELTLQSSPFTTQGPREGVYVKISDGRRITHRFKMVRQGFVQGGLWSEVKLKKNKLGDKHGVSRLEGQDSTRGSEIDS
jgi:atypical dual specificity phosphatase